ncbi:signal peptidase II [Prochlorococcus sp. MIT 0603]|uniref:signal peptidase II n=1 Tax=unclassified Prochlorococcus TaxID=2627481 RepID=UPI000559EBD7
MKQRLFRRSHIFLTSSIVITLDQLTKLYLSAYPNYQGHTIIPTLIKINIVRNYGAAFNIFSNYTFSLGVLSLIVAIVLIRYVTNKLTYNIYQLIAFSFLIGGTIGNGLDRWRLGYVIDFIQLIPITFPIFNIADIAINLALMFICLDYASSRNN